MEPEVDFETWSLIITTTTNDIDGFSAMLPGLKPLMKKHIIDKMILNTDIFAEWTFWTIFNTIFSVASSKTEIVDILSDFFQINN
mgnify:CR=1 FL=1